LYWRTTEKACSKPGKYRSRVRPRFTAGNKAKPDEDFQADVEEVLECLAERIVGRANGR
jgi:hypothetical protein